jgi:pectate lyase
MPYQDVDHKLRALVGGAEGFGRHAIGGLYGAIHRVTSLQGTLRTTRS